MLVIENDILEAAHITEEELRVELAVMLYRKGRLSYAQARALSALSRIQFDDLLFEQSVPPEFTVEDLRDDVRTLEKLRSQHGGHQ